MTDIDNMTWKPASFKNMAAAVIWSETTSFRAYYISGVEVSKEEFERYTGMTFKEK